MKWQSAGGRNVGRLYERGVDCRIILINLNFMTLRNYFSGNSFILWIKSVSFVA